MKSKLYLPALAMALLSIAGCSKSFEDSNDYMAPYNITGPDKALLKVIHASSYATNPSVQINIDDVRVSNLILSRTPFPGGGFNTNGLNQPDYLSLTPGTHKLSMSIPKKGTNVDSILLMSTQIDLKAKTYHSAYIMDTFTRTKVQLVEDDVSAPPAGKIRYRFINLMPNAPSLDLWYGTTRVATGVIYNTAGVVFEMAVPATAQDWIIRETNTTPILASYVAASNANTRVNQRVLSAFAMGYKGSTVANTRPYISFSINR
jgi:hypothetical protein